jgi:hypothetical protein
LSCQRIVGQPFFLKIEASVKYYLNDFKKRLANCKLFVTTEFDCACLNAKKHGDKAKSVKNNKIFNDVIYG